MNNMGCICGLTGFNLGLDRETGFSWRGQTNLLGALVAPCQACGSVDVTWLCSGTAKQSLLGFGGQRSAVAPPCSMFETEDPLTCPLMTDLCLPATSGNSGGQ